MVRRGDDTSSWWARSDGVLAGRARQLAVSDWAQQQGLPSSGGYAQGRREQSRLEAALLGAEEGDGPLDAVAQEEADGRPAGVALRLRCSDAAPEPACQPASRLPQLCSRENGTGRGVEKDRERVVERAVGREQLAVERGAREARAGRVRRPVDELLDVARRRREPTEAGCPERAASEKSRLEQRHDER